MCLSIAARYADDFEDAVQWARQARRIDAAAIPGDRARDCSIFLTNALMTAGDIVAARDSCTDGLALAREAGDLPAEALSMISWRAWICEQATWLTPGNILRPP